MKKLALSLFKSADEKLRSLGNKGNNSNKTSTNTYCGSQNGREATHVTPSTSTHSVTSARSDAPDIPPPPVPVVLSNQNSYIQSHDTTNQSLDRQHFESTNQNFSSISPIEDIPPPLFPKPRLALMAERRLQRQNRKSGASLTNSEHAKRRSRSEGAQGRRRLRNSMHETSSVSANKNKNVSNGRYSMYTGHISDEEDVPGRQMNSGSESADSDQQRWTKNPLMVRKSRKGDRLSKTDKRRSLHNVEKSGSGQMVASMDQVPNMFQDPQGRDLYIGRKPESNSNRAKFLRLEENRKKRIDMAVTSDEECSPQLRINRLRQRAMLSSNLQNDPNAAGLRESINIVPSRNDMILLGHENGVMVGEVRNRGDGQDRLSVYDENRLSKYDDNYNMDMDNLNGHYYQEYGKPQSSKHNKLPNILPEFLPENRHPATRAPPAGYYDNNSGAGNQMVRTNVQNQQGSAPVNMRRAQNQGNPQQNKVRLSSESPKMRSFTEVKANKPTQLKKAVEKIELISRSPNSSSDSLDELIESNIQYLESEIESGKLKRQSGNFSNYQKPLDGTGGGPQRQGLRENIHSHPDMSVQHEFKTRLQDPRSYVSTTGAPIKNVSNIHVQSGASAKSGPYNVVPTNNYSNSGITKSGHIPVGSDPRHVPISGSATYSPYSQRKHMAPVEDLSKSDSQLNKTGDSGNQAYFPDNSYVPYPVLNQQTGQIMYVQPHMMDMQGLGGSDGQIVPGMDSGMFSDVDYNIEVSERIKKWEKKLTPGEIEERERKSVLNTIKEYESFSDSNQKDSVPDTPIEIRRELRQLLSPTDNSGVGKLSVNLSKSPNSMSDSNVNEPPYANESAAYFEPKVVSSETNLHRIFRVVHEPKIKDTVTQAMPVKQSLSETEMPRVTVQSRKRKPVETSDYGQSLSNVALSESEIGTNMQQSWPPMVIDSDSGIRKSWRMSRYEDEISELKEIVSDNFRDIRKRFDSDVSETDTKRATSPVNVQPKTTPTQKSGTSTLTLNIQPVTPTKSRSPVTIRRKLSDQSMHHTPPASPATIPLTPKSQRKLPIYRSIPVETKSQTSLVSMQPAPELKPIYTPKSTTKPTPIHVEPKQAPDVWSPHMESTKGLVSIERVKARTLQTIPFSEDPVWKEIEDLAAFEKPDDGPTDVNFDEIDALLKLATGGVDNIRSRSRGDGQAARMMSSEMLTPSATGLSYADNLMTSSYTPNLAVPVNKDKMRKLSDSTYNAAPRDKKASFTPPIIQPLKLNSNGAKKSSTSALDEVLEDIRATLQKKPLSPKLMKNFDSSESNSSTNLSLQSPLTKSSKSFVFSKDYKSQTKPEASIPRPPLPAHLLETKKSSNSTPGYDNTQPNWQQQPVPEIPATIAPQIAAQIANATYIDPEFTQFPYIINGNYHLDPNLLSEKLKSTGLVNDSSDDHSANKIAAYKNAVTNHVASNKIEFTPANQKAGIEISSQSKPPSHELDQSVDELRILALEVEFKLNQIKSRIVTADEDRLDSILLALRKFAPMTEQKFFNVKFIPDFEAEQAKRSKLEGALCELDKMYQSLELEDAALMDRASKREESLNFEKNMAGNKVRPRASSFQGHSNGGAKGSAAGRHAAHDDSKVLRKSQIDEIERQTQNEFEDITKSFQVLLDEVTKQCRNVAHGSGKPGDKSLFNADHQYSGQRPIDEIRQEPPRPQLKYESQSQRAVQDSYNTAIKELESVAMGNVGQSSALPMQSSAVYLNIDKTKGAGKANKPTSLRTTGSLKNTPLISPTKNLDIQVQSRAVSANKNTQPKVNSQQFVSMATEFRPVVMASKKSAATETVPVAATDQQTSKQNQTVTLQVELNKAKQQGHGRGGRFRKRGNIEHRKSMPALTRTVETQTVETQTDPPPSVSEMKERYEQLRKNSMYELSSDSSPDILKGSRPFQRKMSSGVMKVSDLYDSSEDESKKRDSKIRHSLSAPDIVSLLDCLNEENLRSKKDLKGEQFSSNITVPKLAMTKSRGVDSRPMRDEEIFESRMVTLENDSPLRKPPVYPVWKYPGQVELPSPRKLSEQRKSSFTYDRSAGDFRTVSDNDSDAGTASTSSFFFEETLVRRRTRSVGAEADSTERPRSFHELIATFEKDPERLEKLRTSGLRKCTSEDSMFTDLILQKIYHSESDLYASAGEGGMKRSSSGLKLALEMRVASP